MKPVKASLGTFMGPRGRALAFVLFKKPRFIAEVKDEVDGA
jgi:hypothetical protein